MGTRPGAEAGSTGKRLSEAELREEMEKVVEDLKEGYAKHDAEESIGNSSIKAATLNMITQMSFRVITFLLNAFVLRHISRDVMGLINVRLNLLDDTIIFLSREGFRLACLGHRGKEGWKGTLNLMWLCVPLSVIWSAILGWVWLNVLPLPSEELHSQYVTGVYMVAVSGVIQMFAEVPWLVGQIFLYVRLRVVLDFVWMATRVLFLVYAVVFHPDNVVEVWALGHLIAGILFVAGYYLAFSMIFKFGQQQTSCKHSSDLPFSSISQLLPSFSGGTFPIHPEYRKVAVSFMGQGVMKQVLTEGERYLMTFLGLLTLGQQGIYDVVANLGSLAARFVFRPVEESCYFFFSQQWKRGVGWSDQNPEHLEKVRQGLARILRLMLLTGLVILVFGFSYSDMLLRLYGGANLAGDGGTALLRAQCLLVAFLAVNGVTECFARSVMTDSEINSFNKKLVFLSVSYLAFTWILTSILGPIGLVLANCANMAIRIFFSVQIIRTTLEGLHPSPLAGLNPDNDILLILLCSGTCCQLSEMYLYFWFPVVHFLLGALLFLVVAASIVVKEDFVLAFIVSRYRAVFAKEKTS